MTVVLDASAVIALLRDESGANTVREILESVDTTSPVAGLLSTVNLTEVLQALGTDLPAIIDGSERVIVTASYEREHARAAAAMLDTTRAIGLGIADRACLSLAKVLDLPAITADRLWSELDLGVEVIQIR